MKRKIKDTEDEVEDVETELVDVEFDFFNIFEQDFLAIKQLLRQLFDVDNIEFNLSEIADLIIEKGFGSTVKADGNEGDPFAVFALNNSQDSEQCSNLAKYWIERTSSHAAPLNRQLRKLFLAPKDKRPRVAIMFSQRMLNLPTELVKPAYKIMIDELEYDNVEYDYVVIPSRIYKLHESKLDDVSVEPKSKVGTAEQLFFFYPEDEAMQSIAVAHGTFDFKAPQEPPESRRTFSDLGLETFGYITVLKFKDLKKILDLELD